MIFSFCVVYYNVVKKHKKSKKAKSLPSDNDYVDNEALLKALTDYRKKYLDSVSKGRKPPPVTDYIGECIYRIASRLASRYNFAAYTYRDDMVNDGVLNCIKYIKNFDPAKSKNPFCYISQICWHSFVRVIKSEKQHKYTAYKIAENMNDPEYRKWFNESFSGLEDKFKEYFGLSEDDVKKLDSETNKPKKKRKKKSKKNSEIFNEQDSIIE